MGCLESIIQTGVAIIFAALAGELSSNNDTESQENATTEAHQPQPHFGMSWDVYNPKTDKMETFSTADYAGGAYYDKNGHFLRR